MPTVAYCPDDEDVREYTNLLFSSLTREQLIQTGVEEEDFQTNQQLEFLNVQINGTLMTQIGKDLRKISEEFEKSPERQSVRQKAQQIDFNNVEYSHFQIFLNELFLDGITRERIVVLFFFCSDVVVRAYSNPLTNLKTLFNWFLEYILDKVCDWVQEHGGWSVVLGEYVPAFSKTVCYILISVALFIYIRKNIS